MIESERVVPVVAQNAAGPKITIVKGAARGIIPSRRDDLLKDLDYLETQIGRLAKMARDVRAKALLLTTE